MSAHAGATRPPRAPALPDPGAGSRTRPVAWWGFLSLVVALAACTPAGDSRQHATPPANGAAPSTDASGGGPPCTTSVDTLPAPPAGYRLVGEDVAVPNAPVMSAEDSGEADPAARLFAKWGLVVRAGTVVDLRVAPGWQDKARLGWGGTGTPAATVTVHACAPAGGQAQWMAFVGGTWVAQAACVPLIVTSNGHTDRVHLGIGVPCDKTTTP
ncbi:hypothetical protein GAR06_03684 [Micromonospora saelicesensis]|uniref:hypothetical protein n=1 Tax=Micromonospora saelicesensis TaxID=285676 RepID=UPI000DC4082C|nr:hypothetical protein [Micromonospora saelicesensis]RAO44946.1 hypothetical protein GAR06_03684 [Micromonospora saelicesensis]